ncbi:hypothetical protein EJ06DRAFT_528875 [Trichodelitschia bisporula]|uniref:Uncharacterized protein n=1 Tax=Trichodelitschia bisporula TaxID=703511 RepID=A0A6G1I0M6_9PEZI|nr:hypothetical protein EJ06DRAFT_528875 [Trichodelitschia bisporula]
MSVHSEMDINYGHDPVLHFHFCEGSLGFALIASHLTFVAFTRLEMRLAWLTFPPMVKPSPSRTETISRSTQPKEGLLTCHSILVWVERSRAPCARLAGRIPNRHPRYPNQSHHGVESEALRDILHTLPSLDMTPLTKNELEAISFGQSSCDFMPLPAVPGDLVTLAS